jgi:hypothetical protein
MYNYLSKNGQLVAFLLGVVMVLIFLAMAIPTAGDYFFDTMTDEELFQVDIFNFGILAAGVLTAICAAGILFFGIYHVASNPKGSIKGIVGVLVIAVLMYLFYMVAAGEPDHPTIAGAIEKYETSSEGRFITEGNLKWIGGAIRAGLLMAGLAFVALIVMPIISPIINRIK